MTTDSVYIDPAQLTEEGPVVAHREPAEGRVEFCNRPSRTATRAELLLQEQQVELLTRSLEQALAVIESNHDWHMNYGNDDGNYCEVEDNGEKTEDGETSDLYDENEAAIQNIQERLGRV